jgi:hypothetical protein
MALEVRDQHLYRTVRLQKANLPDGFGEDLCAAKVVIIAIHAGDDCEFESEFRDRFGDAAGFVEVDGFRTSLGYRAKTAAPGAEIPKKHKGSGPMVPALADVGALCGFADSMQTEAASQLFQFMVLLAHWSFGAKPTRLGSRGG